MDYNYKTVVSGIMDCGEQLIEDFWQILEHPNFPFVSLTSTTNGARNFPPYNIIENEDGTVRLEMAVAGYAKDHLMVEIEGNQLIVRGTPKPEAKIPPQLSGSSNLVVPSTSVLLGTFRHKGISNASFLRTFDLNVNAVVDSVELKDGILTITVSTLQPKANPRRSVEIK